MALVVQVVLVDLPEMSDMEVLVDLVLEEMAEIHLMVVKVEMEDKEVDQKTHLGVEPMEMQVMHLTQVETHQA